MAARYVPPTPEFVEMVKAWNGSAIPEGYEVHNDLESALKPPYFAEDVRTIFLDPACNAHINQDGDMLDVDELRRLLRPAVFERLPENERRTVPKNQWKVYVTRGGPRWSPPGSPQPSKGLRRRTPFKAEPSRRAKHLYRNARQVPVERLDPDRDDLSKERSQTDRDISRM